MILEELRSRVLHTALLLPKYNLVWMAGGTVCARDPETGYVVVTPSGLVYERLTPNDMIVTDLDMNLVEGKRRASVALSLWTGFMRARPELNAVVHTHSAYATAFSVVYEPIPVITETMADWFGQPVPVTRYLSVEDPEFPTLPVDVMGEGFAVLLGNHGPARACAGTRRDPRRSSANLFDCANDRRSRPCDRRAGTRLFRLLPPTLRTESAVGDLLCWNSIAH
jgi:L-ribulose-5-phosphate 4-epimerase